MKWNWPIAVLLLHLLGSELSAQGGMASNLAERKHRDSFGKPCLETSGSSKALSSSSRIFNHTVSLDNRCAERISVRICYKGSSDCTKVDVPGRSRKEQIIGVFPAMQLFNYDVKEQF